MRLAASCSKGYKTDFNNVFYYLTANTPTIPDKIYWTSMKIITTPL